MSWVHATLMESLPLVYEQVVAPLSDADRDAWCRQSAPTARALGATEDVPESWADLQAYIARMHASGAIVVGNTARRLARDVLAPRLSGLIAPVRAINRTITVGLLPPRVRSQYGFAWHDRDARRLERSLALLRRMRAVTPDRLATWPESRRPR